MADFRGDSLGLARQARDADYIVLCGVQFMTETARLLVRLSRELCRRTRS